MRQRPTILPGELRPAARAAAGGTVVGVLAMGLILGCGGSAKKQPAGRDAVAEPPGRADAQTKAAPMPPPPPVQPKRPDRRAGPRTWRFDADRAGRVPAGFDAVTGKWHVVAQGDPPSPKQAVMQQASSPRAVFNVLLLRAGRFADVDITVRMKSKSGRIDQGGGVVWRAADGANYYIARFNPLEDNFRVYVVEAGRRRQLASARLKVPAGRWDTLRVTMRGRHIQCFFNGKRYLDVRDSTFAAAGRIGLWTKADARTYFDDLVVAHGRPPAMATSK